MNAITSFTPVMHRSRLLPICALLLVFFFTLPTPVSAAPAVAPSLSRINVCGSMTSNTTWSADNVYVIEHCTVTVEPGVTLTLAPGAVVKLNGWDWKLVVKGGLLAEGTAGAPIVFTSLRDDSVGGDTNSDGSATTPQARDWGLIAFEGGASGRLTHAIVRYGGYFSGFGLRGMIESRGPADLALDHVVVQAGAIDGLYLQDGSISIQNSSFVDNNGYGIALNGLAATSPVTLINNTITTPRPQDTAGWIRLGDHPGRITLHGNTAQGSGLNGFVLEGTVQRDLLLDWAANAPVVIQEQVLVNPNVTLTLAPGTILKLGGWDWKIRTKGTLNAVGTAGAPLVFTSLRDDSFGGDTNGDGSATTPKAHDWGLIGFDAGAHGQLAHAIVRYGGYFSGFGLRGMIESRGANDVILDQVDMQFSAIDGLYAEDAAVRVRGSTLGTSGYAANNGAPAKGLIDARHNWWGDPSGPYHPTRNPNGKGPQVSDGVLFFPWFIDSTGTEPTQLLAGGPTRVSPGQTAEYALSYFAGQPITNAVLIFTLPDAATYVDSTGGGIYWLARHQLFWSLGDLPAGAEGTVALRVRFFWGIAAGTEEASQAILIGDGVGDIANQPYLSYAPVIITSQTMLSEAQIQAELAANPDLATLYQRAATAGMILLGGEQRQESTGVTQTRIEFTNRQGTLTLYREGTQAWATYQDPVTLASSDASGGITITLPAYSTEYWGSWQESAVQQSTVLAPAALSGGQCFRNCLIKGGASTVIGLLSKPLNLALAAPDCIKALSGDKEAAEACFLALQQVVPGADFAAALRGCLKDCSNPATRNKWLCQPNEVRLACDPTFGARAFRSWECDPIGAWKEVTGVHYCHKPDICVDGYVDSQNRPCKGCLPGFESAAVGTLDNKTSCAAITASGGACAPIDGPLVTPARDPNAKWGMAGDLVPGQLLSYTITYENEGAGHAYSVYITDLLSPHLDEATLDLHGQGEFLTATRTIFWEIGDLAPKDEPGSKGEVTFSIRVKPNLPSNTVISNQAVVYFPSVPEETPTNTVVQVIQPLAAIPQTVATAYGQPIALTLSGRAAGATPLTYQLVEQPRAGQLSGAPPQLLYTPAADFSGLDRFTFTVNNGITTSRPAEVTMLVTPSAADTMPPTVRWSYPADGATLTPPPLTAIYTDALGTAYAPVLLIAFSKALDPVTVTGQSVMLTDRTGQSINASITFDGTTNGIVITPRQPLTATGYRVTLATTIQDQSGNAMPAEVLLTWQFGSAGALADLYLPLVHR